MASAVSRLMSVCKPLRHSKCPCCRAPVSRRSASTSSWVGTSSMAYLPFGGRVYIIRGFCRYPSFTNEKVVLLRNSTQFLLDTADFILHMLFAVGASAEAQGGGDAGDAHGVHHFVAAFDGGENVVPFAFDVGAVSVQFGFQAGFGEHALAGGDFFGHRSPDADGDHAEIGRA